MLKSWACQSEEVPDVHLPMRSLCAPSVALSNTIMFSEFNLLSGDIHNCTSYHVAPSLNIIPGIPHQMSR